MTASKRALDTGFFVLVAAIFLLSVFLRFWNLEVKPLHHDEAVNGFFLDKLVEKNSSQAFDGGRKSAKS